MSASEQSVKSGVNRQLIGAMLLVGIALCGGLTYVLLNPVSDVHDTNGQQSGVNLSHSEERLVSEATLNEETAALNRNSSTPPGVLLWTIADEATVEDSLIPAYKEVVEGRVLLSMNDDLANLKIADEIGVYIPQLEASYLTKIDQAKTAPRSNRVYRGKLLEGENAYFYVVTVGLKNVFGHFETPEGSYELFGNTSYAWLMPSINMDQEVDHSRPDYLVPNVQLIPDNLASKYRIKED